MYKLSEHKDEIVTSLVNNLIWAPIAAIGSTGIVLIKNIVVAVQSSNGSFLTLTNILLCLSLLMSSGVLCTMLLGNGKNNGVISESDSLFTHFRASEVVAELTFNDREHIVSKVSYKMTVLDEHVSKMRRQLIWTGSTYQDTTIEKTNGDYSINHIRRTNSPYVFEIDFKTEKERGEFVKFTTKTIVTDEDRKMSPEYSFMVKFQIDKLKLIVTAPTGLLTNVRKSICADTAKDIVIKQPTSINKEEVGGFERYVYNITNPTFLHDHFIEWDFTN